MTTKGLWALWVGVVMVVCVGVHCRKVATLQLLAGYLSLAGGHVTLMVNSLPHLSRLIKALVQVCAYMCECVHAHS